MPKTLESYQKIVYNKSDKEDFNHYIDARRRGIVSAVASFSDWQETNSQLKMAFIGETAANGIKITGVSRHFVDRTIGSIYQRRDGVSIKNMQKVIVSGKLSEIKVDKYGRKSQRIYIDDLCDITINPETGELIQCNPNSK